MLWILCKYISCILYLVSWFSDKTRNFATWLYIFAVFSAIRTARSLNPKAHPRLLNFWSIECKITENGTLLVKWQECGDTISNYATRLAYSWAGSYHSWESVVTSVSTYTDFSVVYGFLSFWLFVHFEESFHLFQKYVEFLKIIIETLVITEHNTVALFGDHRSCLAPSLNRIATTGSVIREYSLPGC